MSWWPFPSAELRAAEKEFDRLNALATREPTLENTLAALQAYSRIIEAKYTKRGEFK